MLKENFSFLIFNRIFLDSQLKLKCKWKKRERRKVKGKEGGNVSDNGKKSTFFSTLNERKSITPLAFPSTSHHLSSCSIVEMLQFLLFSFLVTLNSENNFPLPQATQCQVSESEQ